MNLDREKSENKLLLEMLDLMDAMAQQILDLDSDVAELEEYVEDIDADLGDMEELLLGEGDECDCDDDDCDCGCHDHDELDEDDELSFDCPNCGKTVLVRVADIDYDESPVCEHCGEPFFTDLPDDEEE